MLKKLMNYFLGRTKETRIDFTEPRLKEQLQALVKKACSIDYAETGGRVDICGNRAEFIEEPNEIADIGKLARELEQGNITVVDRLTDSINQLTSRHTPNPSAEGNPIISLLSKYVSDIYDKKKNATHDLPKIGRALREECNKLYLGSSRKRGFHIHREKPEPSKLDMRSSYGREEYILSALGNGYRVYLVSDGRSKVVYQSPWEAINGK